MKKIYNTLRLCFVILLLGFAHAHAQPLTFGYTGGAQYYTVPAGVTCIDIDVRGASGGEAGPVATLGFPTTPGKGGRVQATLTVVPGDVLEINVGGVGPDGDAIGVAGGWNGGGLSDNHLGVYSGGGGGGASDIRATPYALANRLIVGGGGGGAGYDGGTCTGDQPGGDAGDVVGSGVTTCDAALTLAGYTTINHTGGGSNPLSAGGAGGFIGPGTYNAGTNGGFGFGGDAPGPDPGIAGGGGGGYYGGGGGCWMGGGGGTSYADPTLTSGVTHTAGYNSGNGIIIITPSTIAAAGTVVGSTNACVGTTGTYTNPTATRGGTWMSSIPAVATIDPVTGVASYLSAGITDITYTTACGSFSATLFGVTVNGAPSPITGRLQICEHEADTLFDATPGGTWSAVTPANVTIDPSTGQILGSAAPGSVISYYTGVGCPALATLTVNQLPLPIIVTHDSICEGSTVTFIDGYPGGTWSSNYPPAGTIDPITGDFTAAVGFGVRGAITQIVYTTALGCSTSHTVVIDTTAGPISGPVQSCLGGSILLTDAVSGGTWSSSALGVATIGSSGLVTSVGMGVTTISYTTPGCPPATSDITINPLPAPIIGSTAICPGYVTTLTDASPGGTWLSNDSRVSVSATGDVTSSFPGIPPVIITYTLPTTCFTTITVNVTNSPSLISGPDSLCQGLTGTMVATPPGGGTAGVWSSTNLAIAPIDTATGTVTALSAGTVNLSYTLSSGCYSVKSFLVETPAVDAVTVTATPPGAVCSGDAVTLVATSINGGALPTFTWKKFSTTIPGATSNVLNVTPTHGDVINIFMTPDPAACVQYSVVADSFFMNVYPDTMQPLVNINTPGPLSVDMLGQTIAFFSNVTWGGTTRQYQWYVNNHAVPGATNSSFSLTIYEPDTIYCSVTGNVPCPATVVVPGVSNSIVISDVLGVKPVNAGGDNISVIPNPSNGSFVLSGTLANVTVAEVTYEISNMLGQTIYSGTAKPANGRLNESIKLANAADGSYLLKVNTGAEVRSFHIVVAK